MTWKIFISITCFLLFFTFVISLSFLLIKKIKQRNKAKGIKLITSKHNKLFLLTAISSFIGFVTTFILYACIFDE